MQDDMNILYLTDSYKVSHWLQLPPKLTGAFGYLSARGGTFPETIMFGLQPTLNKYLNGPVVRPHEVEEADKFYTNHFGRTGIFNRDGWMRVAKHHNGMLPVRIRAIPEGTMVSNPNALATIESLDPELPWLPGWLEGLLLHTWYGTTVCTLSFNAKLVIMKYLIKTGTPELIDFKLHDFGFRGCSSVESASMGAAAHLVNFKGTDTVPGIKLLMSHYYAGVAGNSIPASEHFTSTAWGGPECEIQFMEHMLDTFPTGPVACISDTWDIFRACSEHWGTTLKKKVLSRDGVLIIRPDSGEPIPMLANILDILGEKFSYYINEKGYKVLDDHVRIIQGDGNDLPTIEHILDALEKRGWSADNIAFGMGGALLQKVDRDTLRFALKASSVVVNYEDRAIYKDPVTDPGKRSMKGRLKLVQSPGGFRTISSVDHADIFDVMEDQLVTVFENGGCFAQQNLTAIRERTERALQSKLTA